MKKETIKKTESSVQKLSTIKGRAMLQWYEKSAPKSVEWFPAQVKEIYGDTKAKDWNKIFWGDNKQVLSHLLKEYRGKIDLIYIDPPFDSKADYVKRIKIKGKELGGVGQNVIEEMQYADIWEKDEYLQFMYERLILMRELLSETGTICLHCDWHKGSHLKLMMDEVFGEENFINDIVWWYENKPQFGFMKHLPRDHDMIFCYAKNFGSHTLKHQMVPVKEVQMQAIVDWDPILKKRIAKRDEKGDIIYEERTEKYMGSVLNIGLVHPIGNERTNFPTQKPETLLTKVLTAYSNEGDIVLDCFMGSGTTLAVAQKLNRKWIGCDINKGAIITTTERINKIMNEQSKANLFGKDFKGLDAFKVYNVNHYEVFTNDIQARQLLIETYRIEELTRGDFDGTLGSDYVKIVSPNRVLGKMDVSLVLDAIKKNKNLFTVKKVSKQKDATFENKVIVICSGAELDVRDFVKKENNTGVEIEIRDIQIDKKELDFKKPTEANISYSVKGNKLTVDVKDYYSPLLMKRLELENEKRLSVAERVQLFDYRQALEHIVIDVNYGEGQKKGSDISFNAEVFLRKEKKGELVDTSHEYTYDKKGTYTVAVKIVDVLGEEYFETHEIVIK